MTTALAMSAELAAAGGTEEDRLLAAALRHEGCEIELAAWTDGDDWRRYASVLVRSCWDYHLRPADFFAWIDRLESRGTPVLNPVPLLRWNVDKRYLLDLEARGVPIVPTVFGERFARDDLDRLRERWATDRLVAKPSIGATAYGCRRLGRGDAVDAGNEDPSAATVLVQPFLPAVVEEGEWSLMLFDGELSHTVVKRPAAGEFRVQKEWGGSFRRAEPDGGLVALARRAVEAVDPLPAYARVDVAR